MEIKIPPKVPKGTPYSQQEDRQIVKYIAEDDKRFLSATNLKFWYDAEKQQIIPGRTAWSLHERWRKLQIALNSFDVDKELKRKIHQYAHASAKGRKKMREQILGIEEIDSRQRFTKQEDRAILEFRRKNEGFSRNDLHLWEAAEKLNICPGRSANSLMVRYRRLQPSSKNKEGKKRKACSYSAHRNGESDHTTDLDESDTSIDEEAEESSNKSKDGESVPFSHKESPAKNARIQRSSPSDSSVTVTRRSKNPHVSETDTSDDDVGRLIIDESDYEDTANEKLVPVRALKPKVVEKNRYKYGTESNRKVAGSSASVKTVMINNIKNNKHNSSFNEVCRFDFMKEKLQKELCVKLTTLGGINSGPEGKVQECSEHHGRTEKSTKSLAQVGERKSSRLRNNEAQVSTAEDSVEVRKTDSDGNDAIKTPFQRNGKSRKSKPKTVSKKFCQVSDASDDNVVDCIEEVRIDGKEEKSPKQVNTRDRVKGLLLVQSLSDEKNHKNLSIMNVDEDVKRNLYLRQKKSEAEEDSELFLVTKDREKEETEGLYEIDYDIRQYCQTTGKERKKVKLEIFDDERRHSEPKGTSRNSESGRTIKGGENQFNNNYDNNIQRKELRECNIEEQLAVKDLEGNELLTQEEIDVCGEKPMVTRKSQPKNHLKCTALTQKGIKTRQSPKCENRRTKIVIDRTTSRVDIEDILEIASQGSPRNCASKPSSKKFSSNCEEEKSSYFPQKTSRKQKLPKKFHVSKVYELGYFSKKSNQTSASKMEVSFQKAKKEKVSKEKKGTTPLSIEQKEFRSQSCIRTRQSYLAKNFNENSEQPLSVLSVNEKLSPGYKRRNNSNEGTTGKKARCSEGKISSRLKWARNSVTLSSQKTLSQETYSSCSESSSVTTFHSACANTPD